MDEKIADLERENIINKSRLEYLENWVFDQSKRINQIKKRIFF